MIEWLFEKAPPALVVFLLLVLMAAIPLGVAFVLCAVGGMCE